MNNKIKSIKPFIEKEERIPKIKPTEKRIKSKHGASKKGHAHKHNLSRGQLNHQKFITK